MNKVELHLMYKMDTGSSPVEEDDDDVDLIDVYRSKGQWVLNMTDEEVIRFRQDVSKGRPDRDYVEWLENKVMEYYDKRRGL